MFATAPELSWQTPREAVRLKCNEIHVWCAALSNFENEFSQFWAILSTAERARAERFLFFKDRTNYVIRRGILRVILGRYSGQLPSEIDFCYGRNGKPEIKKDRVRGPLYFNDSHSVDLALYALTRACPIGVDVEQLREVPHIDEIASRFFSPCEVEMLMALPTECRMESFFACWTRKEAVLKATGEGIAEGMSKVEVTRTPGEDAEFLRIGKEPRAGAEWHLRSFSPAPAYLGAVAFRHQNLSLSKWRVPVPWG